MPKRRRTDRGLRAYRELIRDLTTIIVLALALAGVVASLEALEQQRDGRRAGQAVTCGALNAVIDAGRTVIQAQRVDPATLDAVLRRYRLPVAQAKRAIAAAAARAMTNDEFARVVRSYGLPPLTVRQAITTALAEAYAKQITDEVIREGGAANVVRSDGLLSCERLRQITGVNG